MHQSVLVFILICGSLLSKAQHPIHISIQNSTLAATDSLLPFWFSANRQGKIENQNFFLNLTDLFIGQDIYTPNSSLSVLWGGSLIAGLGQSNYYQVNRAYAGVSFKGWKLTAGMFYDRWFMPVCPQQAGIWRAALMHGLIQNYISPLPALSRFPG